MWEHFTTKPLVDAKTFRRVGDCPTPWPCFVIAVREELLDESPEIVQQIIEIINTTTMDFKNIPSIDRTLSHRYEQQLEDIQEWLAMTQWSQQQMDKETLQKVQDQLFELKIIDRKVTVDKLLHNF